MADEGNKGMLAWMLAFGVGNLAIMGALAAAVYGGVADLRDDMREDDRELRGRLRTVEGTFLEMATLAEDAALAVRCSTEERAAVRNQLLNVLDSTDAAAALRVFLESTEPEPCVRLDNRIAGRAE